MKRLVVGSAVVLAVSFLAACSSTSEQAGATAGAGAAPVAAVAAYAPGTAAEFQAVVGNAVFFALDSHALDARSQEILRRQAAWLRQYPERALIVEGHADERGTREYNLALGERRATAVRDFLLAQGLNGGRLHIVSFGKERPACTEAADACWSQNRRGVSIVQ